MKALIDLDPLPYSYGGMTFDDGALMPDSLVQEKVDNKIKDIVKRAGADSWIGYLSDSDSNFRIGLATILPYKGNRTGKEKPPKYQMLRDYLQEKYPDQVTMIYGMEADDALAIDQYAAIAKTEAEAHPKPYVGFFYDTIICTIDKDLEMVPGWHYKWAKGSTKETHSFFVNEVEGLRFFYKQLLTGDMTDNIRGLYGVSTKSKLLSNLNEMDTEQGMFLHVKEQYVKRFGNYAEQFMLENGRLLWMLQSKDDVWELPTYEDTDIQF